MFPSVSARTKKLAGPAVAVGLVAALSACSSTTNTTSFAPSGSLSEQDISFRYDQTYGAIVDSEVNLPAFDYTKMDKKYLRQWVRFPGGYEPGTIVVDTEKRHLFLVQPGGRAIRYGIAVGKEGFAWHGDAVMQWKQPWPTWTPPEEMIERKPELKEFEEGMPAGVENPLGARAMYLFRDGRDTLFRIHGTNRPYSIGKAASSGCFRMINQDVIDLYSRVKPGAKVYVRQSLDQAGSGV